MEARAVLKSVAFVGLWLAAASCAVDSRELRVRGNAGAGSSAGMITLTGDSGDDSNAAPPLPICDYSAGVADGCESLVANPGFSQDTDGWRPEDATVTMSWRADDAAENSDSGSLSVVNSLYGTSAGFASRAAAQCLPTEPGKTYAFALDVFIPKGQGEGLEGSDYLGSSGLSVIFYTSKHCDEFTLDSKSSDLLQDAGVWAHREGRAVAPKSAQSMSIRLVALKQFQQFKFEAQFDNVLVKAE